MENTVTQLSFFIDEEHHQTIIRKIEEDMDELLRTMMHKGTCGNLMHENKKIKSILTRLKKNPYLFTNYLDGRSLRFMNKKELVRKMVKVVLSEYDNAVSAHALVQKMMEPFLSQLAKEMLKEEKLNKKCCKEAYKQMLKSEDVKTIETEIDQLQSRFEN
jgi:hypothetical protein